MPSFHDHSKYVTIGSEKIFANLCNIQLWSDKFKVSKSEILSLFTSKQDKADAEKLFDYFDRSYDCKSKKIKTDGYINKEEADSIQILADLDENDADYNITSEILQKETGVSNTDILLTITKYLTETKDYTKNIKSGMFEVNDVPHKYNVEPVNGNGRTYRISCHYDDYTVTFGGVDAGMQVMISDFYATLLNITNFVIQKVKTSDGEEGVTHAEAEFTSEDKIKKLGIDLLIGNTGSATEFNSAFDINAKNQKKSFTFVPDEFDEIMKNNSECSSTEILSILEAANNINENDLIAILKKHGFCEQYKDILLKRKEFLKEMLETAKSNIIDTNLSGYDYFNSLKIGVLKNQLEKTDNKCDLVSFQKSIDRLEKTDDKIELQKILNKKQEEINPKLTKTPLPEVTLEEFIEKMKEFGYKLNSLAEDKSFKDKDLIYIKRTFNKEDENRIKEQCGAKSGRIESILTSEHELKSFWEIVNQKRKEGIDILADKSVFDSTMELVLIMDWANPHTYTEEETAIIRASMKLNPTEQEFGILRFYKSDDFWQINNAITTQRNEDKEPLPKASQYIDSLTKFLNKSITSQDTKVYRGEGYEIFQSIKLADGRTLGDVMQEIKTQIPDSDESDKEESDKDDKETAPKNKEIDENLKTQIENLISEVQDSNFIAYQERFLSTTLKKEVAKKFGKVELVLNLPAGSKAVCIEALNYSGMCGREDEVLCQRGSNLQITDLSYDYKNNKWCVYANVITN